MRASALLRFRTGPNLFAPCPVGTYVSFRKFLSRVSRKMAVPFLCASALALSASAPTRAGTIAMAVPLPLPTIAAAAKTAAALPTMYALMSANEYATHRWYQHAEFNNNKVMQALACFLLRKPIQQGHKIRGGGHVEHHAETYDDMTLKRDQRWSKSPAAQSLDSDKWRGTAFTWKTTALMTFQMLWTTIPAFHLLGFNLGATMAFLLPSMLLHALIWNMLHPPMHGLPDVPFHVGAPSTWLSQFRNSAYFRFIYQNHQGHHVLGGQCNYNVCCPLVDHLLGTYEPVSAWAPAMRAVPSKDDAARWGDAVEPKGVPQAPIAASKSVLGAS